MKHADSCALHVTVIPNPIRWSDCYGIFKIFGTRRTIRNERSHSFVVSLPKLLLIPHWLTNSIGVWQACFFAGWNCMRFYERFEISFSVLPAIVFMRFHFYTLMLAFANAAFARLADARPHNESQIVKEFLLKQFEACFFKSTVHFSRLDSVSLVFLYHHRPFLTLVSWS